MSDQQPATPYLRRPLRSEAEARVERENRHAAQAVADATAAVSLNRAVWGKINAAFAPPRPTLADRQATRADRRRRRLSRYAHLLCAELDRRELSGKGLHEEERGKLMALLTDIRRALA